MEWPPLTTSWGWSGGRPTVMIEQAKEELQILEAQHPNRFEYLKLELKSFISLLEESQNMPLCVHNNNLVHCVSPACMPSLSSATTQASSTTRKRKKGSCDVERVKGVNIEASSKNKVERVDSDGQIPKRRRIDVVIERAQACLHKIQLLKTSFC